MRKNKFAISIFIMSLFLILSIVNFAQDRTEQRKKEIEAVRNLIHSNTVRTTISNQENQSHLKPEGNGGKLYKTQGQEDRKHFFMNGNKISTNVYNYGGIGPGYGLIRGINNFIWQKLDYVFQFCPFVGAVVDDENGKKEYIISDALWDYPYTGLRDVSPEGKLWQWQPLPDYADPDQPYMASMPAEDVDGDGKPDSWPRRWYNTALGKYVWPGYLSQDVLNADLEVLWAMDDRDNDEFAYFPFDNDRTRKGLGVVIEGRAFQWSNALAENAIFFVYTITNVSDKDMDSVIFGIYGDPDLGGGSPENTDDNGFFVPPYSTDSVNVDNIPVYARSMVYFWDPDMKGRSGLPLGYLGCKYLESPGNPDNGIDDDGDGMIDESQFDGIDNDGDWNPETDDVGIDGIPNTGDLGEGDGIPTAGLKMPDGNVDPLYPGEPNFELTDLDEADQIGLTSFNSWTWSTGGNVSDDKAMWYRCIPGNFGNITQNQDIVFIFSSGYISLKKGETKRISMALLCGWDLDDLLTGAETIQTIYNQNYRFFKPPTTPNVWAVPGDKKVTLFWDTIAEESVDPITGKDFEGYVIYRSTDHTFNDIQKITDGKGSSFLNEPLKDINGFEAKWDLVNEWEGYHPVSYQGRGIQYYLGNNSGIVHSFVDTNKVINGQTYYYTVVAYDHGDSVGIPPSETTKKITLDPITNKLRFDNNTVQVIPGPRASGYIAPKITNDLVEHTSGIGTGRVTFQIINDLELKNNNDYIIQFSDSIDGVSGKVKKSNYSVLDESTFSQSFILYDTNFTSLSHKYISDDSYMIVKDEAGNQYTKDVDYVINFKRGSIRRIAGRMTNSENYFITYRYYPIYQSIGLEGEDFNPVFDGIRLRVYDEESLSYNDEKSEWIQGNCNYEYLAKLNSSGLRNKKLRRADYQITFSSTDIDSAVMSNGKKYPVKYSVSEVTTGIPVKVLTFLMEPFTPTKNFQWDPNEEIVIFWPGSTGNPTKDTVGWGVIVKLPSDSTVIPIAPTDGDVLLISTHRPFDKFDQFKLTTYSGYLDNELASSRLDKIYVVPNPYIGFSEIEPTNKLPGQSRGERRIYFENLPPRCTIRIFSISGDLVKILEHDEGYDNGREFWNLLNIDGFSVAYGLYIAHIDAPGIGEKLVKFALIK
ncbi:MAG: hypothetical protein JW866_02140 [Ignavibacteriales bacterium]|nr:hypothetical protein [Ignavibacteriales bacterium]